MFNSKIVFGYFFQVSILSSFPVCWILVIIFFFSSLSTFIMDVLVFVYSSLHLDLLKVIASHCIFPCIWSVTLCFCAFLIFLLKTRHFSYPIIASVDFVLFSWELLLVACTWTAIFISPKCALTDWCLCSVFFFLLLYFSLASHRHPCGGTAWWPGNNLGWGLLPGDLCINWEVHSTWQQLLKPPLTYTFCCNTARIR